MILGTMHHSRDDGARIDVVDDESRDFSLKIRIQRCPRRLRGELSRELGNRTSLSFAVIIGIHLTRTERFGLTGGYQFEKIQQVPDGSVEAGRVRFVFEDQLG